jgi:TolB protein
LRLFTNEGSVGQTPPWCKAQFDAATANRIAGGGNHIGDMGDDFYVVWKKVTSDLTLTAHVQFVGTSTTNHRKGVLIVRQNLDRGSMYAGVASQGNGLTSLQFRGASGEHTYQTFTQIEQPARVRLVRKGSRFTMYSGKPNEDLTASDPVEYISLKDPVYVGLGVFSHVATPLETAIIF